MGKTTQLYKKWNRYIIDNIDDRLVIKNGNYLSILLNYVYEVYVSQWDHKTWHKNVNYFI